MNQNALMSIQQLHINYDSTPILHGIDIEVHRAEIVAMIGRNGMGKSTLMKACIGLLPARAGRISYDGTDITNMPANKRARLGIGYVPQGREIFANMTVEENLIVGELVNNSKSRKLYNQVYDYFPFLSERRRQKGGDLSGGQQQMLAIGRALVGNPDMLLLDEPSEGIQPSISQEISRNVSRMNADLGLTVLFVEQNVDMITSLAQRCYVLNKGEIVEQLSCNELADTGTLQRYLAL